MADYPVTLAASKVSRLADIEAAANGGYNFKASIDYSDIAVASATGSTDTVTVSIGSTPTKWAAMRAVANVTTAFAGTSALTCIVGVPGATDAFIASASVLAAGFKPQKSTLPVLTGATSTAATTIQAVFTNATGDSPSALTAGKMDIYLSLIDGQKNNVAGGLG